MRCDTCCRTIRNPYAHDEYDCANWPEMQLNSLTVEYRGYTLMYVGGEKPYEVYRGDALLARYTGEAEAFMFIERNEDNGIASNRIR